MDVCKCIVPSRVTSPPVRLVEGEERWEAYAHPQSVIPLNWGGIEQNLTVTYMMLKAKANDRRQIAFAMMNLMGFDLAFANQTDHLIETSAHASQHTMVMYTGMGTVGSGSHGLLQN
ncbi:uncharacterized protein TNCV_485291 [Trichonephila clavipes]|nr:uncharacterized protein TNCV_485291 [Trichonephila clavipes]